MLLRQKSKRGTVEARFLVRHSSRMHLSIHDRSDATPLPCTVVAR